MNGTFLSQVYLPGLGPSTLESVFPEGHPLPTGDLPHWGPFSRTVTPFQPGTVHTRGLFPGRSPPSNRGPSTLEAIFPDGHPFQPGTVHAGGRFPGWSPSGVRDEAGWRHPAPGRCGPAGQGRAVDGCGSARRSAGGYVRGRGVAVVVEERVWEEVEAWTAFPQSRPQLPPAAAVGGFCGGAPCPAGSNSVSPWT